ncbi:hypothetical protein E2C01_048257 [Portunus trituberculatus]|uniref:Uncharacterized protein n=1 Tax=Portunus trituberculatus TaxID=210409 RepID=A0A5B7GA50_PORTR|nr:hypothetical protein [Portunus trituberculatus]
MHGTIQSPTPLIIYPTVIDDTQKEQAVMNQQHTNDELQSMEMVLPPGNFTIRVKILDVYDSCNEVIIIENLEESSASTFDKEDRAIYGYKEKEEIIS